MKNTDTEKFNWDADVDYSIDVTEKKLINALKLLCEKDIIIRVSFDHNAINAYK